MCAVNSILSQGRSVMKENVFISRAPPPPFDEKSFYLSVKGEMGDIFSKHLLKNCIQVAGTKHRSQVTGHCFTNTESIPSTCKS